MLDENGFPTHTDEDMRKAGYLPMPTPDLRRSLPPPIDTRNRTVSSNVVDSPSSYTPLVVENLDLVKVTPSAFKNAMPLQKDFIHSSLFNKKWITIFDYHGQNLLDPLVKTSYTNAREALSDLAYVKETNFSVTNDLITVNATNEESLKSFLCDNLGLGLVKKYCIQTGLLGGGTDGYGNHWLIIMGQCNSTGQPGFLYYLKHGEKTSIAEALPSETQIVEYCDPPEVPSLSEVEVEEVEEDEKHEEQEQEVEKEEVTLSVICDDIKNTVKCCIQTCAHTGQYVLDSPLVHEVVGLVKEATVVGYNFVHKKLCDWRRKLHQGV